MPASYPGSVKSFSTKSTNDVIQAAHVNDIQDEVVAVEGGLVNGLAQSLLPFASATYALGSASKKWTNLFLSSELTAATAVLSGQLTVGSGGVLPFDATGKIQAISSTYFASLSAANLTGLTEAGQTLADNTTNDVSITKHGYAPRAPSDSTKFLNGANPPAWTVPASSGALTLLHEASGTDGTSAATVVDTYALASQLTVKDSLLIIVQDEQITQVQTAAAVILNTTDSKTLFTLNNSSALAAGEFGGCRVIGGVYQSSNLFTFFCGISTNNPTSTADGTQQAGNVSYAVQTVLTAWTGAWTIGLKHGGQTAGGTYKWRWMIYKVAGQ